MSAQETILPISGYRAFEGAELICGGAACHIIAGESYGWGEVDGTHRGAPVAGGSLESEVVPLGCEVEHNGLSDVEVAEVVVHLVETVDGCVFVGVWSLGMD